VILPTNSVLTGGSNKIQVANNSAYCNFAGDFTIEGWVYVTDFKTRGFTFFNYWDGNGSASGARCAFNFNSGTNNLNFNGGQGGVNPTWTLINSITVSTNTWYHVAFLRYGSTFYIYINGVQYNTAPTATWAPTYTPLVIGAYYDGYTDGTGYVSNFRVVNGTAVYTSAFTPPTAPLTAIANTSLLTCNSATIVDNSGNNYSITTSGTLNVSSVVVPFTARNISSGVRFLNRSNVPLTGTQKAIFGYGYPGNVTNLVSNTGVVANDTVGVGTWRAELAAASYGTDKAIFGYGAGVNYYSLTNLVSNTGVVANDTAGVGTARQSLAAAAYGNDKAIFGYGHDGAYYSITNKVSNTGVVSTNTTGIGTTRRYIAASGYGIDKAIFGYGNNGTVDVSMTNLVSNTGVVATDTAGVGTARGALGAACYGVDKAIFGYGSGTIINLVSNTGVVATDTAGAGTGRGGVAAASYNIDKAIFGYGYTTTFVSMTNLVSNTGVVATDTTGVGTARYLLAAAGYSTSAPVIINTMQVKKVFADPVTSIVTSGLVLYLDAGNASSYSGTGTTWTDLSGNGNNGTLINGPTFNSANGGSIVFDGSNDYIQFSTVSAQTVCFWGRMDTGIPQNAALVATSATGDGSLRTNPVGTFRDSGDSNDFHNGYVSSLMINGVSNLSSNGAGGLTIPDGRTLFQDFYVGAIGYARNISTISHIFDGRAYKGRVYAVYLYNRQLTNAELLQNYNVTKARFGL